MAGRQSEAVAKALKAFKEAMGQPNGHFLNRRNQIETAACNAGCDISSVYRALAREKKPKRKKKKC